MGMDAKYKPHFSSNTYAQNNNGILAFMKSTNGSGPPIRHLAISDDKAKEICTNGLGDITAIVLSMSEKPVDLDSWAAPEVAEAIERGLATSELQSNFQANTTRAEFCRSAVNFLEQYYNEPIADILKDKGLTAKPFADTSDPSIATAAALGITQGTSSVENLFSPNLTLTREQAAAMLARTLIVTGVKTAGNPLVNWTDANDISDYATNAIDAMYAYGIMSGLSNTALVFSPKSPYTHEQSIMTFNRLFKFLNKQGNV